MLCSVTSVRTAEATISMLVLTHEECIGCIVECQSFMLPSMHLPGACVAAEPGTHARTGGASESCCFPQGMDAHAYLGTGETLQASQPPAAAITAEHLQQALTGLRKRTASAIGAPQASTWQTGSSCWTCMARSFLASVALQERKAHAAALQATHSSMCISL